MGRPKANIDWDIVDRYLRAGCDGPGIAGILGIHEDTMYIRCMDEHKMTFSAYRQKKKAEGDELLRMKQFEVAYDEGDKTMLIWLGKNRLDQKDKQHTEVSTPEGKKIIIEVHDAGSQGKGDEGLPTP